MFPFTLIHAHQCTWMVIWYAFAGELVWTEIVPHTDYWQQIQVMLFWVSVSLIFETGFVAFIASHAVPAALLSKNPTIPPQVSTSLNNNPPAHLVPWGGSLIGFSTWPYTQTNKCISGPPSTCRLSSHSYLSAKFCPLDVFLLLLGNGDTKNKGVDSAGHCCDQHNGCQPQRQSKEKGEAEESLPAHCVTGLVEASIVQTQVAEYLSCYEQPEGVGHHPSRDAVWKKPEAAQQVENNICCQSHWGHQNRRQLVSGVDHCTHDDDVAVKEGREHNKYQQGFVPLPSEVGLVEVLQRLGREGEAHEPRQAQAASWAPNCDLMCSSHRLARVRRQCHRAVCRILRRVLRLWKGTVPRHAELSLSTLCPNVSSCLPSSTYTITEMTLRSGLSSCLSSAEGTPLSPDSPHMWHESQQCVDCQDLHIEGCLLT